MTDKYIITAEQQLQYAFRLGARVLESGFRPNLIVAIWRGGAPIGRAVQARGAAERCLAIDPGNGEARAVLERAGK